MATTHKRHCPGLATYKASPAPSTTTEPSLISYPHFPPMVEPLVMTQMESGHFSLWTVFLRAYSRRPKTALSGMPRVGGPRAEQDTNRSGESRPALAPLRALATALQ